MSHFPELGEMCVCLGCQGHRLHIADRLAADGAHGLAAHMRGYVQPVMRLDRKASPLTLSGLRGRVQAYEQRPVTGSDSVALQAAVRATVDLMRKQMADTMFLLHFGPCPPGCDNPVHRPLPPLTLRQRARLLPYRLRAAPSAPG
jgi:hypothetical protein